MSVDPKKFGITNSLVSAVNEALKGGQVKLDKNHNGKLDSQDFKMLRKEDSKQNQVDEGNPMNKAKKNAAAAAVGAQNRDAHHNAKRGMRTDVADKIRGREVMQGQSRVRHEEVEQVDELSTDTYHRAAHKAAKRAMGDVQGRSGPIFKKYAGMANKFRDKGMSQEKKEKAMKEETVSEVSDAAKKVLGAVAQKHGGKVPFTSTTYKDGKKVVTRGYNDEKGDRVVTSTKNEEVEQIDEISKKLAARYNNKVSPIISKNQNSGGDPAKILKRKNREAGHKLSWNKYHNYKVKVPATNEETDPGFVAEADNAVAKQIAAKKDQFKKGLQQKIAAKQMNVMQAKANKRLSNIHASNDKCSCQEGKGKSMTCEVHGDKANGIKGGKEQIIVNPPMREAAELPKKVITKGHEIAKSLIKHKSKVDNPYAVGMAAAKKSAKIKAYRADRNKHGED